MPVPPPKYTDAQREAVAAAKLGDNGRRMTAVEVSRAAARGDLGVPAFSIPSASVYRVAERMKERREAARFEAEFAADPFGPTRRWAVKLLEISIARSCALLEIPDDERTIETERQQREVVRTVKEIRSLLRTLDATPPDDEDGTSVDSPANTDFSRLLADSGGNPGFDPGRN
jgi:hypothetical protein